MIHKSLHRAYHIRTGPEPMLVEFHEPDCTCPLCASVAPAVRPIPRALTIVDLGWLALAAAAVGSAIAFAIDPHGAWHALASCFAGR